jgi:hypothetical protein
MSPKARGGALLWRRGGRCTTPQDVGHFGFGTVSGPTSGGQEQATGGAFMTWPTYILQKSFVTTSTSGCLWVGSSTKLPAPRLGLASQCTAI